MLGSIAPAVSVPDDAAGSDDPAKDEEAARSAVEVDESQPNTSIQVGTEAERIEPDTKARS